MIPTPLNPENETTREPIPKSIHPGTLLHGPFWPEPVEVKLIEEAGEYIHIVGATIPSSR